VISSCEPPVKTLRENSTFEDLSFSGVLPVDVVISTGMGHARNALVANADAVIVVGGGAGTLSEIAFAWTLRRLVIAIDIPGWGIKLAGAPLDKRVRYAELHDDKIYSATDPDEALTLIEVHLPKYSAWGRSFKTRK
jgi:hypothetical protein